MGAVGLGAHRLERAYDRGMPENQAFENQASENSPRTFAAPPGLRLLGADAAGMCADGYCVLPAAAAAEDSEPEAEASDSDRD